MPERLAGVHRRVPDGTVALTFDDGPHPESTTRVLDQLAALGVQATFFCVGLNARSHPEIVRRALAEGHVIGSHSLSHPADDHTSPILLRREYREGRRSIEDVVSADVSLFRPPYGYLSLGTAAVMRERCLSPWLWSVDPGDWQAGVTVDAIVSVAGGADSGDVVLLHDWVEQPWDPAARDRSATIDALPVIVESIRSRGLELTTLPG
ncbi:polysaccharide deacetylase family protein [Modestobacter marinus]|uniref:polysaccharide deacetylase family protein n=1 Tax=Modestobacter marinus TaxID=477641 RepID=UPI001C94B99F|nr:polysaccharide deacetylase family protein [Modestobacter marinus]